jgi:predicted aspartyl protease
MRIFALSVLLQLALVTFGTAGPLEDARAAKSRDDFVQATDLFLRLAKAGNVDAQVELGYMYHQGEWGPCDDTVFQSPFGCLPDYVSAIRWFTAAAEQGSISAQDALGDIYLRGLGIPKDWDAAKVWYRKAAEQGDKLALDLLKQIDPGWRSADATKSVEISLKVQGGTFVLPVKINDTITLDFTLDSGAADVAVPSDVVSTLVRSGAISDSDFRGSQIYVLADGSTVPSQQFLIRSITVGSQTVQGVVGSISSSSGLPLLGQSFLGKFSAWSIDNQRGVLVLTP